MMGDPSVSYDTVCHCGDFFPPAGVLLRTRKSTRHGGCSAGMVAVYRDEHCMPTRVDSGGIVLVLRRQVSDTLRCVDGHPRFIWVLLRGVTLLVYVGDLVAI